MKLLSDFVKLFTNSHSYGEAEKCQLRKSETSDLNFLTSQEQVLYSQRVDEIRRVKQKMSQGIQEKGAVSQGEFTAYYGEKAIGGDLL